MEYEKDAERILEKFSKDLDQIPRSEELIYPLELGNRTRVDGEPTKSYIFDELRRQVPESDHSGNILVLKERMKL